VLPEVLPAARLYILLTRYINLIRMIQYHPKTFGEGGEGGI